MIPLYKLEKLPRSQRLRKTSRIFAEAEQKAAAGAGCDDPAYYAGLLKLLAGDSAFSPAARSVFREAGTVFGGKTGIQDGSAPELRRALNSVRHILLAATGRFPADWDLMDGGRLDPVKRRPFPGMEVYLEDIRSPFNVGAMFRTAESFGAERIILSPLCADPRHPRAWRTAMGCTEILSWERLDSDPFGPEDLSLGGPFFALETGGVDISGFLFPCRGIMIAGSEELGVSPRALAAADASLGRVSIPVYGAKGSLNVSVAFGIAMSAWAEKLKKMTYNEPEGHYAGQGIHPF
ncbi:MAG: TrmH family RNA methyltransferase [Treponema sp.]|jgi:TrmH family RNA methyltransferase|nr:TrmH family RNA methyltransferase [Treponema sp.]